MTPEKQGEDALIAGDDATLKQLVVEARAKIIWGERIEDVQAWMATRGVPKPQVDLIVGTCCRERVQMIRDLGKDGIRRGSIALVIGVICTVLLLLLRPHLPSGFTRKGGVLSYLLAGAVVLGSYGLFHLWRGIERVFSAKTMRGSIPDME